MASRTSVTSLNMGPEKLFSATVVKIVGTLKLAAARAKIEARAKERFEREQADHEDNCGWAILGRQSAGGRHNDECPHLVTNGKHR